MSLFLLRLESNAGCESSPTHGIKGSHPAENSAKGITPTNLSVGEDCLAVILNTSSIPIWLRDTERRIVYKNMEAQDKNHLLNY